MRKLFVTGSQCVQVETILVFRRYICEMAGEKCFLCPSVSTTQCEFCDSKISHCEAHQRFHRPAGDGPCFPYLVSEVAGVGRIVLAARAVTAGEELWREEEMVVGPSTKVPPVCLGCGRRVTGAVRCPGCSWPLCSLSCQEIFRHSSQECRVIAPSGPAVPDNQGQEENCPLYRVIMVLRVLQLPPDQLSYLLQFMDHGDSREREEAAPVVETIREVWGQLEYSEELIRRVEGILDINTVEHRVTGGPSGRAFLPITSLASHSCRSNSVKDKVSRPGWVITRAKVDIKAGQEITFHYCGGLKGRLVRREVLREGWRFWCACERCESQAELGAEMSSLLCEQCGGTVRPLRPLDQLSPYSCDRCPAVLEVEEVARLETEMKEELELCYRDDSEALESLLGRYQTRLHPQHWLVLIIKWLLVTTWGRVEGLRHSQLSEDILQRKLTYARQYLAALDIVDGGISHNRGATLWEIHSVRSFLANKKMQEDRLAPVKFCEILAECLETVREVLHTLQFNKENSNEDLIRRAALDTEIKLQNAISAFKAVF